MAIDKIGSVNKIYQPEKPTVVRNNEKPVSFGADSVSISQEALKAREVSVAQKAVANVPETRSEKIKAIKEKLERGEYDNPGSEILERIAEKIAVALIK